MNAALWSRTFAIARPLLLAVTAVLFLFNWLFVWLSSKIDLGALGAFLQFLPAEWQRVSPVPMADIATPAGRVAIAYVDPVVIFAVTAWSIARGSDAVSGELGRGTLEMVLAQPVRRSTVLLIQAAVTTLGAAVAALACWLGTWAGLSTVELPGDVSAWLYVPAAVNMFALAFFLAGISTLASACDRYRWRTIGMIGGVYVVALVLKLVARMAPGFEWMKYLSFLTAFEPQLFVNHPAEAWSMSLPYNAILLGLGAAAYLAAVVVFCRRDLPAPL
jgi:ABC-2 type transport system permease protein